jgi:L-lactate dehydrogenase complex protein LldF
VSSTTHARAAEAFSADAVRAAWHDQALWFVRAKRDQVTHAIPEWEALRTLASGIKAHTLSRLDTYLEEFERNAKANGVTVHWAANAAEHNRIVYDILAAHQAGTLVKSKSMLTEECQLNSYLEAQGIMIVDSDLGERIIQLGGETPSHIVMPAIHKRKAEVGALFAEHFGTSPDEDDPATLADAARGPLRAALFGADAALTGVNFAIAETGALVVCTNEGNADLGAHLAPLHIASMGIEKLIPRVADLGVFLRLLARSATGQPITAYTSHFVKPRPGASLHVVIVDNGRSEHLGRPDFREALACIRCGACLNTCPIYRRSGGHSYDATIPGPIGAILSPGIDLARHASLPFASTLCGSCGDVCPVKIDIPQQLYRWRQLVARGGHLGAPKRRRMRWLGGVLGSRRWYEFAGWMGRALLRVSAHAPWLVRRTAWGRERELPVAPRESFRDWYKRNRAA